MEERYTRQVFLQLGDRRVTSSRLIRVTVLVLEQDTLSAASNSSSTQGDRKYTGMTTNYCNLGPSIEH